MTELHALGVLANATVGILAGVIATVLVLMVLSPVYVVYAGRKRRAAWNAAWPELQAGSDLVKVLGRAEERVVRLESLQEKEKHDVVYAQTPQLAKAMEDLQEARAMIAGDESLTAEVITELSKRIDRIHAQAQGVMEAANREMPAEDM